MKQKSAFEHVIATNPGVDAKLVEEAEKRLEALRQAGVDYASSYRLDPALGAIHIRSQSNSDTTENATTACKRS